MTLRLLDVVVLNEGLPLRGLKRGDLGTFVDVHSLDAVDVEFVAASGRTQALVTPAPSESFERYRDTNERCTMFIETCIATVILLGIAISGVAQEKPDFSGEWILNRQASTLSPGAAAVQSGVVRIEHREPTFRYEAAFVSEGGPLQYKYELLSDGRETVGTQQGITTVSSLRWEGEALVATWQIQRPDGEMKISFRHELIDAGRRLRAVEQLRGRGRDQDNVWIFERR